MAQKDKKSGAQEAKMKQQQNPKAQSAKDQQKPPHDPQSKQTKAERASQKYSPENPGKGKKSA